VGNVTSQLALTEATQQAYTSTLAPTITNSSISTTDSGILAIGEELDILLDADEDLAVSGTNPELELDIGGTNRTALFDSINASGNAAFTYTIQNGDTDSDGIQVSGITVNGLQGASSGSPLNISGFTFPETLGVDADGTPPTINSVSTTATGPLNAGDTINIKVDADEDLSEGSGTPTLELAIGGITRTANFTSIDGNSDAIFTYTVKNGDEGNINVAAVNPGTDGLEGDNGNDLDTSSFSGSSLGVTASTPPVITNITTSSSGPLVDGNTLEITVDANEDISGTNGELSIDIGGTTETITSNTITAGNAVFEYTVQAADNDSDGVEVSGITVNDLQDADSNPLDASSFVFPENLGVNIDAAAPEIINITSDSAGSTLSTDETLTITVDANEELIGGGTGSTLTLNINTTPSTPSTADFSNIDANGNAVFTYDIKDGDNDSDGIEVDSISVGSLTDAAGNPLQATFAGFPQNISVDADTDPPEISNITSDDAGSTLAVGDTLTITVDADEELNKGSGNPDLELNFSGSGTTGNAIFDSINASGDAVFTYDIKDGDNDSDGIEVTSVTASGLEDAAGNELDPSTFTLPQNISVNADTEAPTISNIISTPNSGTLEVGDTLSINVDASEVLSEGSGTPQLTLDVGGTDRTANFDSIVSSNSALFTYTIQSGDNDSNGIAVKSVTAGGLQDDVGNELDPSTFTFPANLGVNADTAPVISDITATNTDSILGSGDTLTIEVDANEDLTKGSGTPKMTLDIGGNTRTASFDSLNSGNAVFTYTLDTGDNDSDGIEVTSVTPGTNGLADAGGNDLDVTTFGFPVNLGINSNTIAPTITDVISSPSTGAFGVGSTLTITVDASKELIQGTGTPEVTLDIGGTTRTATFDSIASGNAKFTYDIQAGDNDSDGIEVTAVTPGTDGLEDAAGNDLDSSGFTGKNLGINADTVAPTIAAVTASPNSGTLAVGDTLAITADADEDLIVGSGSASLELTVGGTTRTANFREINAGNAVFEYTIQSGDNDDNGIEVAGINPGADGLQDVAGNILDSTSFTGENLGVNAETDTATSEPTTPTNEPPSIDHISLERKVPANGQIPVGLEIFAEVFSDPEGASLSAVRINDLPDNGTLLLDGESVSSGQIIAASELDTLVLEPDEGFTGTIRFRWNASDGERFSLFNKSLEIDVQQTDDAGGGNTGGGGGTDGGFDGGTGGGTGGSGEIVGSNGNDVLDGTPNNDILIALAGDDKVAGFSGNDRMEGDAGNDTLNGDRGEDSLNGGDGADELFGGPGNDLFQGGNGNDVLNGDVGDDAMAGGGNNDLIISGPGNDIVSGNDGNDTIFGGQGADVLNGDNDDDTIFGGQQADVVAGGAGNDFLSGDFGEDVLSGGEGQDRFLLRTVTGPDIITDFEDGVDSLMLPTGTFPLQPNGLTFADLNIIQAPGGTVVLFEGNAIAGLTGIDATTVTEEDFEEVSSL